MTAWETGRARKWESSQGYRLRTELPNAWRA